MTVFLQQLNKKRSVFIVAEIGKNFIRTKNLQPVSVYLKNTKKLVDAAKESGADAVKFQTHNFKDEQLNLKIFSPHFNGSDRYNWVKRNTFSLEKFWKPLKKYCDRKKIIFFSTPMSRGAAELLENLKVPFWKVGSGDILDFVMLDYLRQTGKPVIISSGMSTLAEIKKAVDFIKEKNSHITLLHCVSKYPCPASELNLKTIPFLRKKFKVNSGFSDHSLNISTAVAAAALGAVVIEKHFSFSRNLWGPDHKVSLTPSEFKKMVDAIRKIENNPKAAKIFLEQKAIKQYFGKTGKFLRQDEAVFRPYFRKTLVAACDIAKGRIIKSAMVYAVRPRGFIKGLGSENYCSVVGKKAVKNLRKFEPFN